MKIAQFSFQDEGNGTITYPLERYEAPSKNVYEIRTSSRLKVNTNVRFTEGIPTNDGSLELIEEDTIILKLHVWAGKICINLSTRPDDTFILV